MKPQYGAHNAFNTLMVLVSKSKGLSEGYGSVYRKVTGKLSESYGKSPKSYRKVTQMSMI